MFINMMRGRHVSDWLDCARNETTTLISVSVNASSPIVCLMQHAAQFAFLPCLSARPCAESATVCPSRAVPARCPYQDAWVGGVTSLQPELLAQAGIGLVVCCADHLPDWARPTATASCGLNGFAPR